MEVGGKDVGVFVDSSVLNYSILPVSYFQQLLEPVVEKIDLEVETPPLHIAVEVRQVRVVLNILVVSLPAKVAGQHIGERGLARAYIAGYGYVLGGFFWCSFQWNGRGM